MEKNIFEGAKFGDTFITIDHKTAIYLGEWESRYLDKNNIIYKCWIEGTEEPIEYNENGKVYNMSRCIFDDGSIELFGEDILSPYFKSINEEELDELADKYVEGGWNHMDMASRRDFKAGYRKAMEN